ncbi:hypothetical protein TNCV_5004901 [Trichonephila clavipes]|uniref:DUF5641 domain-containing protein n=1 Tax=Trichonephila clavipes TaxID=2585209 RepID=A0A8X6UTJ4_TRICX|nr:hypothetical protein TNCV_5004901 [Trichonephila clavipes]
MATDSKTSSTVLETLAQGVFNSIATKTKMLLPTKNFQVNDLCLTKDDNLPPTKWKMGIIVQLHPGPDNIVNVKTPEAYLKEILPN